jgi:hypothetical protein
MKVIAWEDSDPNHPRVTLVAQNEYELRYLNQLISEFKATASGDSYEVIVHLREGKTVEGLKVFLSTKKHFQIEQL